MFNISCLPPEVWGQIWHFLHWRRLITLLFFFFFFNSATTVRIYTHSALTDDQIICRQDNRLCCVSKHLAAVACVIYGEQRWCKKEKKKSHCQKYFDKCRRCGLTVYRGVECAVWVCRCCRYCSLTEQLWWLILEADSVQSVSRLNVSSLLCLSASLSLSSSFSPSVYSEGWLSFVCSGDHSTNIESSQAYLSLVYLLFVIWHVLPKLLTLKPEMMFFFFS